MYRIIYNDQILFDPYGDETEFVTNASMHHEINSSSYLDFVMSRPHPMYDKIAEHDGVVRMYWDSEVMFEGVIESIDIDIEGNKSISCVSALDYLNDTLVRPYSTTAGEYELTCPASLDGYFQWLIDQHNSHVLDSNKVFEVGINQASALKTNNYIAISSSGYSTTADEITNNLIDDLGGYLSLRYDHDRKILDLYSDVHEMNPQIIDFGVNITDFTKTTNTEDQYTALIVTGGTPSFINGDFESGTFEHWDVHPNTSLSGKDPHGGSYASYFVEGRGEYVNDSYFYSANGSTYKSTIFVRNERSSDVKVHFGYQYFEFDSWKNDSSTDEVVVIKHQEKENEKVDYQWVECSVTFTVERGDGKKIRPRWYFDPVSDNGQRIYVDDFDFVRMESNDEVSEEPVSLRLIQNGTTSFSSDMKIHDDVLYSESSVSRYGYRETTWSDESIIDIDDLVEASITQLNKLMSPTVGIDVKAVDLSLYMDGYDQLRVGQAVRVRSKPHNVDEYLMVSSIDLDLQDPGQTEYSLGVGYDTLTGQQSGFLKSLNASINSSLDAVAALDSTTKNQAVQIGAITDVANSAQESANNAQQAADQAQNTANNASDKADQAQSAADNAQQTADAAKDKADQNAEAISEEERKRLELEQKTDSMIENVNSFQQQTNESFEAMNSAVDAIADQANTVSERAEEIAGLLDDANAVIDRHEDEIGSLTTTITNTVDKLDNLEIGARNLIRDTKVETGIRVGINQKYDKEETFLVGKDGFGYADHTVTLLDEEAGGWLFLFRDLICDQIKPATDYVLSFEVQSNVEESFSFQIQQTDGKNCLTIWNGSERAAIPVSTSWTKIVAKARTKDSFEGLLVDTQVVYLSCAHLTSTTSPWNIKIRKLKLEEGTVATDWSPAPEDLETIADEALTVSTEVKQTAEEIRATAESAYSNANEALTQSSEAVQTANSIRTTLEQDYSTTDELNQTFASKSEVEQTATSIKSEVSQTYATKSSLDALQNIADSAIQTWTGNGIPTLSKPPANQWTTTELKQQHSGDLYYDNETGYAFRFGSSDGVNFSWARIADSDITKALADAAKAQETADGAIDEVEQLKIDIPGTYATKTEVTQTADSIRSEVSAKYTTKETFENFAVGGTNLSEIGAYSFNSAVTHTNYNRDDDLYKFTVPPNLTSNWGYGLTQRGRDYIYAGIPWNEYGILSFYVYADKACTINIDVNTQAFSGSTGDTQSGNDHDINRDHSSFSIPANQWTRIWSRWKNANTNASTGNPNKVDLYDNSSIGIISQSEAVNVQIKKIKFEKGTKPTDWSPCPSDVASDISDASGLAQSALDKSTTVEQDLNGFRTTVSETYTTKTEFNNLKIGGTNLIKGSKPYDKSGFFKGFNSVTDNEYGEVTLQSTTTSQSYPNVGINVAGAFTFDKTDIVKGDKYVISYDVMMLERTYTASSTFTENWIGIRHYGGNWSGLIKYDGIKEDFLNAPLNEWAHFEHPITANAWDGITDIGAAIQFGTKSIGKFHFRMRNVKLEKGTKATSWSPAPEDIDESFADLADIVNENNANVVSLMETSINQTKDSITSQVAASYYTKTEAEELMAQMSTQFQQTEDSFEMEFNSLRAIVDQVNESADTNYSNIQKYIRFVDGHIVIGVEGNPFSLDIGNDRISFMQNNSEIAYISNHEFYITSGIITQNLRIGNFEFRPRSNGNLSLVNR